MKIPSATLGENRWIAVTERMPEVGQPGDFKGKAVTLPISDDLLLYWHETKTFAIGYYDDEKKKWGLWDAFCASMEWCDYAPSHWMPMPEEPQ